MSIYREEAMEALLEALQRKDFPSSQVMALGTLSSLSGHFGGSRKAYMECWLLKVAGFDQPYNAMMRGEETKTDEEEFAEMVRNGLVYGLLDFILEWCIEFDTENCVSVEGRRESNKELGEEDGVCFGKPRERVDFQSFGGMLSK